MIVYKIITNDVLGQVLFTTDNLSAANLVLERINKAGKLLDTYCQPRIITESIEESNPALQWVMWVADDEIVHVCVEAHDPSNTQPTRATWYDDEAKAYIVTAETFEEAKQILTTIRE